MKKLRIGLVGLPNVGKSSFFKVITKKQVLVANYPFSTINANSALVDFYDERVIQLGNFFRSKKITFDTYEFVDIAGIIKGASQKIGLGGEFLAKIKSVDLVCHVVRCFKNDNITHLEESVDPVRDLKLVCFEFINADLQQLTRRLEKISSILGRENSEQLREEEVLLQRIVNAMGREVPISEMELTAQEEMIIKPYDLLTTKPSLVIANYNFDSPGQLRKLSESHGKGTMITIDANLENEYKDFSPLEKRELGYLPFSLQGFSRVIISKLQLKSFFTAGKGEARNWVTYLGSNAVECAGLIHSDIKNKFARAEVYQLSELGSKNTSRRELASYIIKDGEVCNFLFS